MVRPAVGSETSIDELRVRRPRAISGNGLDHGLLARGEADECVRRRGIAVRDFARVCVLRVCVPGVCVCVSMDALKELVKGPAAGHHTFALVYTLSRSAAQRRALCPARDIPREIALRKENSSVGSTIGHNGIVPARSIVSVYRGVCRLTI